MVKALLVGMLVSGALFAATENMIPSFSDFDTNRDGKVTKPEFEMAQKLRMEKQSQSGKMMKNIDNKPSFKSMDGNKNGSVDTIEFSEHQAAHRAKLRNQ